MKQFFAVVLARVINRSQVNPLEMEGRFEHANKVVNQANNMFGSVATF